MAEGRDADRSTIRRVRVPRVPAGDALGLQLAHDAGGRARVATAGATAGTLDYGVDASDPAAPGNAAAPFRSRIRRLRVDR